MTAKQRYILGLGNFAMEDDGIGLHIVESIREQGLEDGFEAIEVGNDGMSVLTYFTEETGKILLVDCARMDASPGDYRIFSPDDVATQKTTGNISTHEGDIMKLLQLAREIGSHIPDVMILAIEPSSVGAEMRLSETLQQRLSDYVTAAVNEVRR